MVKEQGPICFCCKKPIPKKTTTVYVKKARGPGDLDSWRIRHIYYGDEAPPTNIDDCRMLTNQKVLSVKYDGQAIYTFSEWDGHSYKDPYFCKGTCAIDFAYVMAKVVEERRKGSP